MTRQGVFLSFWFVLIFSLALVLSSPLSLWRSTMNTVMPDSIRVQDLQGKLWHGAAVLQVPSFRNELTIQWSFSSLFEPLHWQIQSNDLVGWGQLKLGVSYVDVWLDYASITPRMATPMLSAQNVAVNGAPLIIDRFYSRIDFAAKQPTVWRGIGHWAGGEVQYPVGTKRRSAQLASIGVEWQTQAENQVMLLESQQGELLIKMDLTPAREVEISIMPSMIKAIGQPWKGSMEYPVFTLVQPLPWL